MTQEDRKLLLKDLCGRLPYKPKIQWDCADYDLLALESCEPILARIIDNRPYSYAISILLEEIKPYLRPMLSMTEEEQKEFESLGWRVDELDYNYPWVHNGDIENVLLGFDWLNAHHFDYHGLIPMGLAIKAPEEMYK